MPTGVKDPLADDLWRWRRVRFWFQHWNQNSQVGWLSLKSTCVTLRQGGVWESCLSSRDKRADNSMLAIGSGTLGHRRGVVPGISGVTIGLLTSTWTSARNGKMDTAAWYVVTGRSGVIFYNICSIAGRGMMLDSDITCQTSTTCTAASMMR
jgi:hypothetical protein